MEILSGLALLISIVGAFTLYKMALALARDVDRDRDLTDRRLKLLEREISEIGRRINYGSHNRD